jgi:outer membrane protein assembly factor BamB
VRRLVAAGATVAAVALVAAGGYRVLAPAEVVSGPTGAYPSDSAAAPGVVGTLPSAPVVVAGRLRVYAAERQVRADGPVDSRYMNSPYWSYRRWPAQLVGVVAAGGAVVSRWSDGELVALAADDGRVRWRTDGPPPQSREYDGRATGARTVYEPVGLTATRDHVVVTSHADVRSYDAATGAPAWRMPLERPACRWAGFTTADGRFGAYDSCTAAVRLYDAATGADAGTLPAPVGSDPAADPLGCTAARSACAGVRVRGASGARAWTFGPGGPPVEAPAVVDPGAWLVDGLAVLVTGGQVVGREPRSGAVRWRHLLDAGVDGRAATVLATQPGRVHLLTPDRELLTLDAGTGAERSRTRYTYFAEPTTWLPGYVYAADGIVATERLRPPADPADDDALYYLNVQPVILAAT